MSDPLSARIRLLALTLGLSILAAGSPLTAQLSESLTGRVWDEDTAQAVSGALISLSGLDGLPIDGLDQQALTSDRGEFRLEGVPSGSYMVQVQHLSYGVHTHPVRVEGVGTAAADIFVTTTAIRLEPVVAAVGERGSPASRNTLRRAEIAVAAQSGMTLAELLRRNVAGISSRSMRGGDVGGYACVEFRGARLGDGADGICRPPQVYLDGTVVPDPLNFFGNFSLEDLQLVEVVPPSQAGTLGPNGAWGAIRLETRTPGYTDADGIPVLSRRTASLTARYDWSSEANSHSSIRVYAAAVLGNAVGLAAAGALLSKCMDLRTRSFYRGNEYCGHAALLGSGIAAAVLPPITAGLAARWAGTTDASTGVLGRSILYSLPAFVPGFALASIGAGSDDLGGVEIAGVALILVGAPILNTIADRFYRSRR